MPLYEYECDACGHRFEVIQKFSDPLADTCPNCKGTVHKLFSSPAIQFKGSGFYITDYPKGDTGSAPKSDGGKADNAAKAENASGKSEKSDKPEKAEKSEKSEKADKADAPTKADTSTKTDKASSTPSSASKPSSTPARSTSPSSPKE